MVCKLNKPEACFNCPYPDCIDTSTNTSFGEVDYLKNSGINIITYNTHKYRVERKKYKSREWNRIHQKEQTEKRREYFREYHKKRKEAARNA